MILRSEKHLEITCQNINLHSPAVCTITLNLAVMSQRILLDKCLMFCQARA